MMRERHASAWQHVREESSARVTLVLLGAAALAACGQDARRRLRRDLYASKEDCLKDWGDELKCAGAGPHRQRHSRATTAATGTAPSIARAIRLDRPNASRAAPSSSARPGSHADRDQSHVSRGGFGAQRSGARIGRLVMHRASRCCDVRDPRSRPSARTGARTAKRSASLSTRWTASYWDESHCYRFTAERSTRSRPRRASCTQLALDAVEHIVDHQSLRAARDSAGIRRSDRASWRAREPGAGGPLRPRLRRNGSAEAARVQRRHADRAARSVGRPVALAAGARSCPDVADADQFNSLHEKLIANWRAIGVTMSANTPVHFACVKDSEEDFGNIEYQRDVATQAGIDTRFVYVEDIGWADDARLLRRRRRRRNRRCCASSIPGNG